MNNNDESQESVDAEQLVIAFGDCGWNDALDTLSDPSYATMSQAFLNAAVGAENDDDAIESRVLRLLASACSLMLSPEKS